MTKKELENKSKVKESDSHPAMERPLKPEPESPISPESLKAELREALLAYRRKRPSLSLRAIARNSGVNRYFLNKILETSGSKDNRQLDLNQVLLISNFLNQREFIAAQSDSQDSKLNSTEQINLDLEKKFRLQNDRVPTQINFFEKRVFIIMLLASTGDGTNRHQVKQVLGAQGQQAFDQLLNQNAFIEQDDRVKISDQVDFKLSEELVKHHLGSLSDCLSNSVSQDILSYVDLRCHSANAEAIGLAKEIYIEAQAKIKKIMTNEKYFGNIKFFGYVCMDHFLIEEDIDEEG